MVWLHLLTLQKNDLALLFNGAAPLEIFSRMPLHLLMLQKNDLAYLFKGVAAPSHAPEKK